MQLSEIGKIATDEWEKTAEIRNHISLGEWVVMPNHIHGVLIINNNDRRDVLSKRLYDGPHPQMSKISPTKNSISTAIRFFKRQTTVRIRKITPNFAWQPRFHDHIICDENELNRISEYMLSNPQNWENDDHFAACLSKMYSRQACLPARTGWLPVGPDSADRVDVV